MPRSLIALLALWVVLQSLIYPEISFIDGNMQNSVVDLATAYVEWQRVEIGELHVNSPDVALCEGRFYSGMAPGVSWLAVPLYALARPLARHLPTRLDAWIDGQHARVLSRPRPWPQTIYHTAYYKPQIVTHMLLTTLFGFVGGGLAVLMIFQLARALRLSNEAATWSAALYALGTPMLYYHASYYTQSVALLLLLVTLWLLFCGPERPWRLLAAAFCAALAGTCDYPYFAYAGLALLAGLLRSPWRRLPRRALWMLLGGFLPLAGVLWYHQAAFGNWHATSYGFRYRNPYPHHSGLYGINLPSLPRLRALLLTPGEGLLPTAPGLLLACWGLLQVRMQRRRPLLPILLLALTAVATLQFCSIPWPSTTAAYGPRFFLPGLLALSLLAGLAWPRWRRLGLALLVAAYLVNHLHMIGADPWECMARLRAGGALLPPTLNLWPITQTYPFATGLLIDLGWMLLISIPLFAWLRLPKRPALRN
jgi:hypothetical protein